MKKFWTYSKYKRSLNGESRLYFKEYSALTKTDCKDIYDEPWYEEYVKKFTIPKDFHYKASKWAKHEEAIDYELLLRFVAASHSSEYRFILPSFQHSKDVSEATIPNLEIKAIIKVDFEDRWLVRSERVSNLFGLQIYNLFNIYVNE